MKTLVDINCDLGESYGPFTVGNDSKVMPHITSANIACGYHAGDPNTISKTIKLAKSYNVAIGAHPGLPDLIGFGRREMQLTTEEAMNYTIYQVSAIQGFAKATGVSLQHVKPHGALYTMAAKDEKLSKAIVEASRILKDDLIIFAPPKSTLAKASIRMGLRVANEFFADRAYNNDGSLVSRTQTNSIIQEPRKVVERAIRAVREGQVLSVKNETVELGELHTMCVHGDTPAAARLVEVLRKGLTKANIKVEPVSRFI